jgi:ribonuclease HI
MSELPDLSNSWTIYVDGSKRISGAGARVVLVSPQGNKMRYVLRMHFANPSNNEAEYEAVLHGMRMAHVVQRSRQMLVFLLQCNIILAYLRKISDDMLYQR